jgi:hypothetical protein
MSDTPALPSVASEAIRRRAPQPFIPLLLLVLALIDLRVELQLMADSLTITTLLNAIRSHTLAVVVLLLQPSLWRRYGRSASR